MSTIKADAIEAATGIDTDLILTGKGAGVPEKIAREKTVARLREKEADAKDDGDNQKADDHKAAIAALRAK